MLEALSTTQDEELTNLSLAELAERLHDSVKVQSALTVFYDQCVAGRLGLNPTDQRCLNAITKSVIGGYGQPVTPGELARVTNLTTGAVTGVLDRLEQAGYVRREHDADDRRRIIVRPVLERIHRDVEPIHDWMSKSFTDCCSQYSESELRLLIDFTTRVQELLKGATLRLRDAEKPPAV